MDIILKWLRTSVTKQSWKQQNSVFPRQRINRIENRLLQPPPKLNQKRRKRKIDAILDSKHTHASTINLLIITCHSQVSETIIDGSHFIWAPFPWSVLHKIFLCYSLLSRPILSLTCSVLKHTWVSSLSFPKLASFPSIQFSSEIQISSSVGVIKIPLDQCVLTFHL